jgi:hypothetical protein
MIDTVIIYTPTEKVFFKIGDGPEDKPKIEKISAFMSRVTIKFDDGYKIVYKGLPYSLETK